jgi:hypothetical protein
MNKATKWHNGVTDVFCEQRYESACQPLILGELSALKGTVLETPI